MSTCTSCSEVLSASSPSLINRCGHVFHESCGFRISTCPSCLETMTDLEKIYFSVFTCDNVNPYADLVEVKTKIEDLEAENKDMKNAPDCDVVTKTYRASECFDSLAELMLQAQHPDEFSTAAIEDLTTLFVSMTRMLDEENSRL